jgi:riboflavin synthase
VFSGIVESVQPILKAVSGAGVVRIEVRKPAEFNDLKIGDSIAVDGVCLTVEAFTDSAIQFALAAETLKILKWPAAETLPGRRVNLERSLRYGDRIHGHLVSGHVDSLAQIVSRKMEGESLFLDVEVPRHLLPYLWKKGSVTLNGVSLTINELEGARLQVCLIPETVKRTNLGDLKPGDWLNVEPDWMAKALNRALQTQIDGAEERTL